MKERPILFSSPMVRALLAGTKTQTRRLVKEPGWATPHTLEMFNGWPWASDPFRGDREVPCPYGNPGDRLWVRETWAHDAESLEQCRAAHEDMMAGYGEMGYGPYYRATEIAPDTLRWRSAMFMPRWASRITLELTDVRVERLQDISAEDCIAEGLSTTLREHDAVMHLRDQYAALWDSINAKRAPWASTPWVWVLCFRRVAPRDLATSTEGMLA